MTRLLPLLILVALALAPFGRIGAAEPSSHPSAMQGQGHCAGESVPGDERDAGAGIDCMIACAGVASAAAPFLPPLPLAAPIPRVVVPLGVTGIHPDFEPPPPRFS